MPSFVHTILVHRHFDPSHFVHAIFCPPNFSPKILCPFNFVLQLVSLDTVGTMTFWSMIHFVCLISSTTLLCPIIMELFFHRLYISIHITLCPAGSDFSNSFAKPLNSHVHIICPISKVHIIIDPLHT